MFFWWTRYKSIQLYIFNSLAQTLKILCEESWSFHSNLYNMEWNHQSVMNIAPLVSTKNLSFNHDQLLFHSLKENTKELHTFWSKCNKLRLVLVLNSNQIPELLFFHQSPYPLKQTLGIHWQLWCFQYPLWSKQGVFLKEEVCKEHLDYRMSSKPD